MTMPTDIGVIDTMIGVPVPPADVSVYEFLKPLYMDRESKEEFDFPVEYMFKDVPRPKERVRRSRRRPASSRSCATPGL